MHFYVSYITGLSISAPMLNYCGTIFKIFTKKSTHLQFLPRHLLFCMFAAIIHGLFSVYLDYKYTYTEYTEWV